MDARRPDTAKWAAKWHNTSSDEVNRKLDTASGLNHKSSGLKGLGPVKSTIPQLCPTPRCLVWFGQHEKIQEGCGDWRGGMVGLRVNRTEEIKLVS